MQCHSENILHIRASTSHSDDKCMGCRYLVQVGNHLAHMQCLSICRIHQGANKFLFYRGRGQFGLAGSSIVWCPHKRCLLLHRQIRFHQCVMNNLSSLPRPCPNRRKLRREVSIFVESRIVLFLSPRVSHSLTSIRGSPFHSVVHTYLPFPSSMLQGSDVMTVVILPKEIWLLI